jgi:two-component system CheB/CheR fusion protein
MSDRESPEVAKEPAPSGLHEGFIVGLGASAGGLEALEQFFDHMPPDTGAVYVVVQHLSPDHKSMMSDLLQRHTEMPVSVVEDGEWVKPNHVYLIPPGQLLKIAQGRLRLEPKSPHGLSLPINQFLSSLASEAGPRAVAVVLSGTGSDGTRGAAEINAAGGFLLAQTPEESRFDGMPTSVIATGLVDDVLPAPAMAERILSHFQSPFASRSRTASDLDRAEDGAEALDRILALLKQQSGIDFAGYKASTVVRRIERRMQVRHVASMEDYVEVLRMHREELDLLRRELLIPVTSFFRDPEAFKQLDHRVIRPLVKAADSGQQLRAWVAGCSTGEEAYSLAMLFLEAFDREGVRPDLKIFATDVNEQGIEFAAAGRYPESAAVELGSERLKRFFSNAGSGLLVRPELRQCIVFARHNLLSDPPFTRMNVVTCRNTLIYFRRPAQDQALRRLQYALKQNGVLFLGPSESLGDQGGGLETLDAKCKLYLRIAASMPPPVGLTRSSVRDRRPSPMGRRSPYSAMVGESDSSLIDFGASRLLAEYAPPSVLTNDRHEAIHLFGDLQPFIRMREGGASLDLNRLLLEPLVPVASALLFKAMRDEEEMRSSPLTVKCTDGVDRRVRIRTRPLKKIGDDRYMMVSVETLDAADEEPLAPVDVGAETTARVELLEQELGATRQSLQATIEALETSNEELQATNEELMASNEELQSSNEELQSVNEELNTVNAEYQEKMITLQHLNADLDSMARAVGIATVFVDDELRLRRYSPDAVDLFRFRDDDIGRPLADLAHSLKHDRLIDDLRSTLDTQRMTEREVSAADGTIRMMRILPYHIPSTQSVGAVASFVDVTALRSLAGLQAVIDALSEHVAVLEVDGTIALVNAAWTRFARANGDAEMTRSGPGSNYFEGCGISGDSPDPSARRAIDGVRAVLEGTRTEFSMRYPCHSPRQKRWFIMNVVPVRHGPYAAVVSHLNITPWYRPEDETADAHG